MPVPLLVILNPWAGRGRGAKARHLVQRALRDTGVPYEYVETTGPGHAIGITREAVAAGVTRIIAASGDGIVHEVANALLQLPPTEDGGTPAAVGCIPLGTGNDFAKLVGVWDLPPEVAAARMVHADTDLHDAGHALGEWFDNIFGVGFDAEVVRHANTIRRLRGVAVYLAAIYRTFLTFRPPILEVVSAEHHETSRMMMLAANIGVAGGGKFYLTPQADPRDGKLDVCLIRAVGLLTFLGAVPKVMKGTHVSLDEVALFQTSSVTIRSADGRPLVLQLDGELREPNVTEVTVTIAPRRLRVLHPR
jgi:YegS/Rv2252/BmrU family lipid kinase